MTLYRWNFRPLKSGGALRSSVILLGLELGGNYLCFSNIKSPSITITPLGCTQRQHEDKTRHDIIVRGDTGQAGQARASNH